MDSFWQNKKVFITGHTGFKGSWLSLYLDLLGARVSGYALEPSTEPSLYRQLQLDAVVDSVIGDIRDRHLVEDALVKSSPDIIFHLAAQPLVRDSYLHPIETYETNVIGTAILLNAARLVPSLSAIVIVTTDKCYFNYEQPEGYREEDRLGGFDPYSSSKACTEILTDSFRNSFFDPAKYEDHGVAIATARSGNVIGGGDWSDDRLIPDAMGAIGRQEILRVRYPDATRPWQHVLDPLRGYLMLAKALTLEGVKFGEAFNFGPARGESHSVADVLDAFKNIWHDEFRWSAEAGEHLHEAGLLHLDCTKAATGLSWQPLLDFQQTMDMTVQWYRDCQRQKDVIATTKEQIGTFLGNL